MRGDVSGHSHCDTTGTVYQQVRYFCRHNRRLPQRIVEVVHHVYGFLFQVIHHSFAHQLQASLRITHGSSPIPIDGTEVSLTVHQRITHAPFLCHTH